MDRGARHSGHGSTKRGIVAGPRRAVGLLGGSFNPPHDGHRHISLIALRRLGLSQVWWLITPGNPLKDRSQLAVLDERIARASAVSNHPLIRISTFEAERGLTYTYDTLRALAAAHRDISFVWMMGADNLAQFHLWQQWRDILHLMPVAVFDRPGARARALTSPAATAFAHRRIDIDDAHRLAWMAPPAWCFLPGPLSHLSSTALRNGDQVGGNE